MQNSDKIANILENKLTEHANKRGNIIFSSLGKHKRKSTGKQTKTTNAWADPRVYSLIGKLHTESPPPNIKRRRHTTIQL